MKFEIKDTSNLQQSLEAIVSYIKSKYSEDIKSATVYITLSQTRTKTDEYSVSGTDIIKGAETMFNSDQYELIEKLKTEIGRYKHEYYSRIQEIKRQINYDNIYIDDKRHSKEAREKRIKARDNHKNELSEITRFFNELLMTFDINAAELHFSSDKEGLVLTAYNDKCEFTIKKSNKGVSEAVFKRKEI